MLFQLPYLFILMNDQVSSGTDPAVIRAKLRDALPRAPKKQLVREAGYFTSTVLFLH